MIVRAADVYNVVPQPVLSLPEIFGSNFKLTWFSASDITYRVEFNPNLAPSNWTTLSGDGTATSAIAGKLGPLTPSNRLYRVRVLQ